MKIISGKIRKPQKVVIYGPEGIGKSTFASKFPSPLFLDTEGGSNHLDVDRFPRPMSWSELGTDLKEFKSDIGQYKTLVIDTADWAETLCMKDVCARNQKKSIEDFNYGKGYTMLSEEFGRFLNFLSDLIDMGINVVVTAHAKMQKVEEPDQGGSYDKWTLKLSRGTSQLPKGCASLLTEWADMVLFANYKTYVTKDDNNKVKAKGGQRVMYTTHHVCWDAKNRHGLAEELPFEYSQIAHCIPADITAVTATEKLAVPAPTQSVSEKVEKLSAIVDEEPQTAAPAAENNGIPEALARLMEKNDVTEHDIQVAVSNNGYYPADTPIAKYDPDFINGKLIAGWDKFYNAVLYYKSLPFSGENN